MIDFIYTTKNVRIEKQADKITISISIKGKEINIHIEDEMKGLSALFG